MMRKELVNEKVVRAIAIGLSAVMLTTPMTAMAAEGEEPIDGQEPKEEDVKEGSKYEAAEDAVEAAQESTSEEGAVIVLEETATLPSGKTTDTVPNAADAAGAKELENVTVMDDKGNPTDIDYTDVEADETAANGALVNAEAGLIQTDAAEVAAAVDVEKANEITDEIENNNKVITDASQKASDAADVAAEAAQEAADAKTKADAQAAADKAAQAVAEAEAAQAEAQAAYDENVDKLAAAEAELAAAKAKLDEAKEALDGVKGENGDIAAAEAAVTAAEEKAAALKAEVDKEAEALNNSKEAALKAAYENMMAEKSVSNLYDGDSFDEDGVDDKFVDTFGTESAGSGYWKAADVYFELYLKYVYGDNYVKGKWAKSNTLDNDLVYDAERDNVFTVTYKDEEGKEVTALYNYHTADMDGNITIYEKQIATGEKTVITQEEVLDYETKLGTETEDGWVPYEASEDEISVDKDGAKYVATGEATVEEAKLELSDNKQLSSESVTKNDGTTVTTEVTENEEVVGDAFVVSTELDEDGNIVETMNVAVKTTTTTTVTEKKFYEVRKKYCLSYADAEKKGKERMKEIAKELMEEGITLTGNADNGYDGFFELDTDYYHAQFQYEIRYTVTKTEITTSEETNNVYSGTNTYSTTKYENHDFVVGSHFVDKETTETYNYWQERKNTTNDEAVQKAIDGIVEKLEAVKAKQDAAAIALIAAQEAKKDVDAAKEALKDLEVGTAEYDAALEKYNAAKTDFEAAKDTLDEINEDVEEAQQDYEDAVAELDRFVPTPSAGGDDAADDGDDDTIPVAIPVATPAATPAAVVTPIAVGAGTGAGAGRAVVAIDDEDTPLAAGIDNANGNGDANGGNGEDVIIAAADEDENAIVAIEDEETPLASGVNADAKMSWWWLLIVALLGATGYKMYKDHQKKKEEAAKEV